MKPRLHAARDAVICNAYAAGTSQKALAGQFGVSPQAISLIVINRPLPPGKKVVPYVSPDLAAAIRAEYGTGRISLAGLVRRHGLSIHYINLVLGQRVPGRGKRRQLLLAAE